MTAGDKLFSGSIAEIYDRFMVPLIFEPYARDLANRVARLGPQRVLEVAAGTGVVTRALAAQLPSGAAIVATDLNQPMLDHARKTLNEDPRIEWRQADALTLPFGDAQFDAVVCQFGAMFFPDKERGCREAKRVLKPGGRFLFNVWDRIAENDFANVVTEALAKLFPSDPPRFMARTPHGYCDQDLIRAELAAARFGTISIDAVNAVSRAPSAHAVAVAYCQGTPMRNEIESRGGGLEEATRHADEALQARFGHGEVAGRIRAFVITASS